ncbi:MAG TPA: serine/threonine-protein kinase [Bryobacteraceae bacterium]|nr:serine/threonine-protein kinase [Bryobacteraceae bacterium]
MDDQVHSLFHELADLAPAERDRVLRERQIGPEVRVEVESLLSFDSIAAHDFTGLVADAAQEVLSAAPGPEVARCGPYRLVRLLGRGGMGAVYLGERADGEIQQKVAIKLLAGTGAPSRWRDRFLNERQILTSLSHPCVVRVIDAGHMPDGQPYLVMEYVDGTPVDVYAGRLGIRERLALFLQVCDGVSHAHRHLIIHRDLKPSNILVDASGQPKLLDFGLAKLLDTEGDPTRTVERLLTPAYASPEQVRGEIQTTATDIYSLGAILYKLLTGRSPHESETGTSQAMEILAGKKGIALPSAVNPDVPSDLDCIARKALRPEPEERYASAEALASDIRAFLEFRPVEARSGNAWYRTRKFLRRYWIPVTAAALVTASLAAGLAIANRERALALRRFADVRQLSNKLFDIDTSVRDLAGSSRSRQLIVDTALEYLRRLAASVHGDPELALEVGNAYMRVARVQGVPISPNLGQTKEAERNLRIARGFIETALKAQPANRTAMLRMAQIAHDQMILTGFEHRQDEMSAFTRESAEWLDKFHAGPNDKPEAIAILTVYMNVADYSRREQQVEKALQLSKRGAELSGLLSRPDHVGDFLWVSAQAFQQVGKLDDALAASREAARLLDPGPAWLTKGGLAYNFQLALIYQGRILGGYDFVSLDRPADAIPLLDRAFGMADGFVHRDPQEQSSRGILSMAAISLGDIMRQSDPARALAVYDHALRHTAEVADNVNIRRYEVNLLAGSSYALRRLGRSREARLRLNAAFERLQQLNFYPADKIEPGSEVEEAVQALGDFEADAGNLDRAISVYEELLRKIQAGKLGLAPGLPEAVHLSAIYRSAAAVYRRAGRPEMADALEARRRDLWLGWNRRLPKNSFVKRQLEKLSTPVTRVPALHHVE